MFGIEAIPSPETQRSPVPLNYLQLQDEQQKRAHAPRLAIFASRRDHCLADLLRAHRNGELHCQIPLIISNHHHLSALAEAYDIAFHHVLVQRDLRNQAEAVQLELLRQHQVDLIVLARYMQVLSAEFVRRYENRIINIHHSLLPAFAGAEPYHRAYERGVKIIGATAHYVTEVLDDGPIIEQDVIRVSHRDSVQDLIRKGADLEKAVLTRAVKWHISNRVRVHLNRTVVVDDDVDMTYPMREMAYGAHG
jgi:formyltetrahydrofolate deformylase